MAKVDRAYENRRREEYLDSTNYRDEVYQWLQWHQPAKDWMKKDGRILRPVHAHHIMGRGAQQRFHWHCNLITICDAAHAYCHDVCGGQVEIACLMSKMSQEKARIEAKAPNDCDPSLWCWHPEVMALNIGRDSLAGRVYELMQRESIKSTEFERFGQQILDFLDE